MDTKLQLIFKAHNKQVGLCDSCVTNRSVNLEHAGCLVFQSLFSFVFIFFTFSKYSVRISQQTCLFRFKQMRFEFRYSEFGVRLLLLSQRFDGSHMATAKGLVGYL